jgi:hypothetical protein
MIGTDMKSPVNVVALIGLTLGAVFGLAGTLVTEPNLRAASWGLDAVGLVVATALLALKFFRAGNDIVAAGFLVFASWVRLVGIVGSILFAIIAARIFGGEQVLPTASPPLFLRSPAGFGHC